MNAAAIHGLRRTLAAGLTCAVAASAAAAEDAVLMIALNDGDVVTTARLTLAELEAMPQVSVRAVTPWTEGVTVFTGPAFAELAARFAPQAGAATLIALNDYRITVDSAEIAAASGVLAVRRDGELMPVREKGPVWLTFPSADRPELAYAAWVHNWIWQVETLVFHLDPAAN